MNRRLWILTYIAAGFAFWLPSVIVHAIRGYQFGSSPTDVVGILVFPVITSWIALGFLAQKRSGESRCGMIALWMLLGIWMLGPLCTTIGASFSGGGFTQPGTWRMIALGLVLFFPLTFMMSAYDGTLGALVVVTLLFVVVGIISLVRWWIELRSTDAARNRST